VVEKGSVLSFVLPLLPLSNMYLRKRKMIKSFCLCVLIAGLILAIAEMWGLAVFCLAFVVVAKYALGE